jgi:Predicted nucleoside-diphosphate sugar epimerases
MISKIQQDTRNTVFCATRYGNVMCSRGSVIPLFVNQLKNGQSITLTNPNMTRFMMSVDESIDLVLFAFEYGENGDIFVQKSPATNMLTLSEALRELFHSNNSIKTIGTRHGEKVYETLVTKEEMVKAIDMDNYYKIPPDKRTLDYGIYTEIGQEKQPMQEYNSDNTIQLNLEQTKDLLLSLEYVKEQLR